MPREEVFAFPAESATETVSVKVLPAVVIVGAEKLIVYGGELTVPIVEPFNWKTTAVIPLKLFAVTVAVPLCPGANWDGALKVRIVGGACSRFTVTWVLALFPAMSRQLPLTTWPAPSVETVCGDVKLATPERLSVQAKVTVTGVLFQLAPLAAGEEVAVIVGGVSSKLTVAQAFAVRPLVSTALPQIDWLAACVLTTIGDWQLAMGFVPGVHVKVTVTLVSFQPLALGAGETEAVIDGGTDAAVGVRVIVAEADADAFAWLVAVTVTVCCVVMVEGAVYKPAVLIVPADGLSVQVTAWFDVFATVAVKLCVPFA
jgi:hypothetical protein